MKQGLAETFFRQAGLHPDKQAVCCEGESLTYRELADRVARWTHALAGRDVRRGQHVAVLLPNSVDYVALFLVAATLGLVVVPLPPTLPAQAVEQACRAADVLHLIANQAVFEELTRVEPNFLARIAGLRLSVDGLEHEREVLSLPLLLEEGAGNMPPTLSAALDDPFILTMTSGSTGEPKPIVLTQRSKLNRAAAAIAMYGVKESDVTLAATPLYHSLAERLVLIPLLTGGTSVLMARFSPSEWLSAATRHRVTFTIAVSSQLKQILPAVREGEADLSSLRCIVSSSALLDAETKEQLVASLKCDFHECYGASEIAIASNLAPSTPMDKLSSVGRAAHGVDVKILAEDGSEAEPDAPGEIVCRTPMLFGGYYKRPELTRAAMWGDYFRTGDLGRLDAEGYLYFLGRKKDIIITGGINIYPADIEQAVSDFTPVAEAAAFAVPDETLGEVIGLAVVPRDRGAFVLRELRFHCADRLADFQQPRKFLVLDALPRTALGKLARRQLLDLYLAENGGDKK
jgi:long-chain acyl-CoA synthetase